MNLAAAKLVETHSAILFFVGDRVHKVKKAVDLGFLDFREPAARKAACHDEVALNRRLAPDVYLGVAELLDPAGQPCEWFVVMRRMPDDRRLASLAEHDPQSPSLTQALRDVARIIADFHRASRTDEQIDSAADPQALRGLWIDNLAVMRRYASELLDPSQVDLLERLALRYLDGREPLLRQRQRTGMIRDGHGDLIADDVFVLDDGPRILDCLDFDARLRYGDVLNDVAFLAMDLERLGAPAAARSFLGAYADFSAERHPRSLEEYYLSYRAGVRCKVSCLRWGQGDKAAAPLARQFLSLALAHLRRAQLQLVVIGGLPGTGKSTLAEALREDPDQDWVLLQSDIVRKELAGLTPRKSAASGYGTGNYTPEARNRTYDELFRRAEEQLGLGRSVIVDASFTRATDRTKASLLAARAHVSLAELAVSVPAEVGERRLAARSGRAQGASGSDADVPILRAMTADADPWPDATVIATDAPLATSLQAAKDAIFAAGS